MGHLLHCVTGSKKTLVKYHERELAGPSPTL